MNRLRPGKPGLLARCGLVLVMLALGLSSCIANAEPDPLLVSAAADLTPAFREMGQRFEAETGIPITFNFGSSGKLAQQIAEGAPVDVYAAANSAYVEELVRAGRALADTQTLYARGRLTLWTPSDSRVQVERIEDLAGPEVKRIAMANPEHAPYGMAARAALQSAGIWEQVQAKLVFGENIAQTLQFAETGNVDVAIMALSLSVNSNGRWMLIPQDLHPPLDQAMVVIVGSPHEKAARQFLAYVNSEKGRATMRRYGFILPNEVADP